MHLVLARDILPNNTSAIRPILAPSVQQQGRGRAPSSPITDGTDYLSTVPPELGRDYQNPVRTGLCGTLVRCDLEQSASNTPALLLLSRRPTSTYPGEVDSDDDSLIVCDPIGPGRGGAIRIYCCNISLVLLCHVTLSRVFRLFLSL